MKKVKVRLRPLVSRLNLPTVIKTVRFPGDSAERLVIVTQIGEVFTVRNGIIEKLLDIRSQIIKLGYAGGKYDERGLLGLAFHPEFSTNGLFYINYSVAGSQGPGALSGPFMPNPCDPTTLNLTWSDREHQYDHINTIEEWALQPKGQPKKRRTLLNIRRPFFNHNGVNSLNFSPETGRLVYTNGDGGSGYDPFNLSQDDMELAGKIIEIDVSMNTFIDDPPVVTRFDELPEAIQATLTIIAKGVRKIPGISYQIHGDQYIKYVGNVGQDLVEAVYSFSRYKPLPVTQLIQATTMNTESDFHGFINLGWRGWEGDFPTSVLRNCPDSNELNEKICAYYHEAINTSIKRINPLTCYYHEDHGPDRYEGTALTGVQVYMGKGIPDLTGSVIFTDFASKKRTPTSQVKGMLAYTQYVDNCKLQDYSIIDVDYNFGVRSAYYTCLGTNQDQTKLFLGVYSSQNVTDLNQGTVYEIIS